MLEKKQVSLLSDRTAQIIHASPDITGNALVEQLNLNPKPKALIMISGGAGKLDEKLKPRLTQLFSRGVARAAIDINAVLIDGGTCSGVMEMVGQGVADRGYKTPLIGVSPAPLICYKGYPTEEKGESTEISFNDERVPLDKHHSHFVLVDTPDWGGEANVMYDLGDSLTRAEGQSIPAVTILVNGGCLSRLEVLRSVRLGWPIIVVAGSGRLADDIAKLVEERPDIIDDPDLAEIIEDGKLQVIDINSNVEGLERLIYRQLRADSSLRLAWEQFGIMDKNASRQQTKYQNLQNYILILGVVGTILALTQTSLEHLINDIRVYSAENSIDGFFSNWLISTFSLNKKPEFIPIIESINTILRYTIMLIPIMITALWAAIKNFNAGNKWILLRSSAELIKSEIFCYRARASTYSFLHPDRADSREMRLAEKLKNFSEQLMQTEVNSAALLRYDGTIPPQYSTAEGDDGFCNLSPERYVTARLEDQLNFYRNKTKEFEKKLYFLQWTAYIIGGVGTLLAALSLELWIALTASITAAIGTFIQYKGLDDKLIKYNQAASGLINVRSWWVALSADEQANQANIDKLITSAEGILKSEFSSWVETMQESVNSLKEPTKEELLPQKNTENMDTTAEKKIK